MKSRITIEVDFDNGNLPVIQILSRNSEDVRDNLIKSFLQSLQHTSRWCRIIYDGTHGISGIGDDTHIWKIEPIMPQSLAQEMNLMEETLNQYKGRPMVGKSMKFEVDGVSENYFIQQMKTQEGKEIYFLRRIKPPHDDFWYNPETKTRIK